jgi:hypothetical protein
MNFHFFVPLLREVFLSSGMISVKASSIKAFLGQSQEEVSVKSQGEFRSNAVRKNERKLRAKVTQLDFRQSSLLVDHRKSITLDLEATKLFSRIEKVLFELQFRQEHQLFQSILLEKTTCLTGQPLNLKQRSGGLRMP